MTINGNRQISGVRYILEKDYAAVIRRKMDDVYRTTGVTVKNEKLQQENFIVRVLRCHLLLYC